MTTLKTLGVVAADRVSFGEGPILYVEVSRACTGASDSWIQMYAADGYTCDLEDATCFSLRLYANPLTSLCVPLYIVARLTQGGRLPNTRRTWRRLELAAFWQRKDGGR